MHSPRRRVLAIIGFPDVFQAADAVPDVLTYRPIGLEGIDQELIDFISQKHYHPRGGGGAAGRPWLAGGRVRGGFNRGCSRACREACAGLSGQRPRRQGDACGRAAGQDLGRARSRPGSAHRPDTDVSIAAAERVLLPTSRKAAPETIILANGFSCREQIEQCASRPTLHVAELIAGAIGAR